MFIKNFDKITQQLIKVTRTIEFVNAFEKNKELLTNASLLQFPDLHKPFLLTTKLL